MNTLIAVAPSPALSGTSLEVTSGDGVRLPAVPFYATVWPAGAVPSALNSETIRVTAVVTDTLTITRAQQGSTVRTIIVGDQMKAGEAILRITQSPRRLYKITQSPRNRYEVTE